MDLFGIDNANRVAENAVRDANEVVENAARVAGTVVARVDKLLEKFTVVIGAVIGATVGAVAGIAPGSVGLVAGTTNGAIGGAAVAAVVLLIMHLVISDNASGHEGDDGRGRGTYGEGAGGQRGIGTNGGGAERIRRQAPAHVDEDDILRDQQQKEKVCAKCGRQFRVPCLRCEPSGASCYHPDHCPHMPSLSDIPCLRCDPRGATSYGSTCCPHVPTLSDLKSVFGADDPMPSRIMTLLARLHSLVNDSDDDDE